MKNKLDKQYTDLLQDILDNGVTKQDRTGTGTISVFGRQIRHDMKTGFPLLTTKSIKFDLIVTELLWFLRGDSNIKYLVDNNCHIWDGDCYANYLKKYEQDRTPGIVYYTDPLQYRPYSQEEFINKIKTGDEFASKWGELGPIYGKQWRSWFDYKQVGHNSVTGFFEKDIHIDQIQNLINDIKTNPDSRRLMVNAWNVGELDQMVLPPCHYGFQVYTRELSLEERCELGYNYVDPFEWDMLMGGGEEGDEGNCNDYNIPCRAISLMFNMRSNDVPLGLPFNIASYGLLLEIISKMVNMIPEELVINLGDAHIYKNQVDGVKEQLTREPLELPKLVMSNQINFNKSVDEFLNSCLITDFIVENYQSHPTIKIPLSN